MAERPAWRLPPVNRRKFNIGWFYNAYDEKGRAHMLEYIARGRFKSRMDGRTYYATIYTGGQGNFQSAIIHEFTPIFSTNPILEEQEESK